MARFYCSILLALFCSPSWASDPTRPLLYTPKAKVEAQQSAPVRQPLTAIFIKGKKRSAVIEGKLYFKGDLYRGSRIIKINQVSVVLATAEGRKTLTLVPSIKSS